MKSYERMLSLLNLFTPDRPVWSTQELIENSPFSVATVYRHIKSLHGFGLLARVANGSYILGPRILELDRTTRLTDPVYLAGGPVIEDLSARTGHSVMLCILFSNTVMCVREAYAPDAPSNIFSRGQRRPLLHGASAKAILAWLPTHQLRALFAKHESAIRNASLGTDWKSFRARLKGIREAGHYVSVAEHTPGITSIAAPIFNAAGEVLGSLALVAEIHKVDDGFPRLAQPVMEAAQEVTNAIAGLPQFLSYPARALG